MIDGSLNNITRRARLCKAAIALAVILSVAAFAAVVLSNGSARPGELKIESAVHEMTKVAQ